MAVEQFLGHKNESRRAKAALECAVRNKGFLDRMEFGTEGESLHSSDFSSIDKSRKVETPAHSNSVHECRTAATEPLPATFACSEKTEIPPQDLDQSLMCGDLGNSGTAIQLESDGPPVCLSHYSLSRGCSCAWRNARSTRSGVSGISIIRTSIAS